MKKQYVGLVLAMAGASWSMAQEAVVKIGHVGPISGAIGHLGKDNENGARLAIEELNAKGVSIGGKKVKFELVAEDDAADPKQGTAVAQKLVDQKVSGVVGHLNSGTSIPASKIYSDAGTRVGKFRYVETVVGKDAALGSFSSPVGERYGSKNYGEK